MLINCVKSRPAQRITLLSSICESNVGKQLLTGGGRVKTADVWRPLERHLGA